jgi:hypothetical protein
MAHWQVLVKEEASDGDEMAAWPAEDRPVTLAHKA